MAQKYRGVKWFMGIEQPVSDLPNVLRWPEERFWHAADDDRFERMLSALLPSMEKSPSHPHGLRKDQVVELEAELRGGHADDKRDQRALEARMWEILREHNLEDEFRSLFQMTTPLWFSLWIHSPLDAQRCAVVARLLQEIWQGQTEDKDKRAFLTALEEARRGNVPLHVAALPPGHVDLGWNTTFDHCPVCKADPPLEDHSIMVTCPVCGHVYRPDETGSSTEWLPDEDDH